MADSDALATPTIVPKRYQAGASEHWLGHIALANDLIAQQRPALLVCLSGKQNNAYFGLCQCVLANLVDCLCYDISDGHTAEVTAYNRRYYSGFSYLVDDSSSQAQHSFSDESIDLLWIENSPLSEPLCSSFNAWFPKVKAGGIVLVPQIAVRHPTSQVWKLWEYLQKSSAEKFGFHHSRGLGLVRKPGDSGNCSQLVKLLFDSHEMARDQVRSHYALHAASLENLLEQENCERTQIQPASCSAASEQIELDLASGSWDGRFTLKLEATRCVTEIQSLELFHSDTGNLLLAWESIAELQQLLPMDSMVRLPDPDRLLLFCFGDSPTLTFDAGQQVSGPVRIRLSVRMHHDLSSVAEALDASSYLSAAPHNHEAELLNLQLALHTAEEKHRLLVFENESIQKRLRQLEQQLTASTTELERYKQTALQAEWAVTMERDRANAALRGFEHSMTTLQSIEESVSWRLTAPLRLLQRVSRSGEQA